VRILNLLGQLEKVELEMAALYDRLSRHFEHDAEASGLFFRMAMQERSHAGLVRYGKSLVHQAPGDFAEVDFDVSGIDRLLVSIRASMDGGPPASLQEALTLALSLEDSPAEAAHRSILIGSNPGVTQLIRSLAASDEEHVAGLRAFARRRGLVIKPSAVVVG
jgi:rubrerythrin